VAVVLIEDVRERAVHLPTTALTTNSHLDNVACGLLYWVSGLAVRLKCGSLMWLTMTYRFAALP